MTNHALTVYWVVFAILLALVIFFDRKYLLLRDKSKAQHPPYSFSRVQLTWWTLIVFSSFISIIFTNADHNIPQLWESTLYLLGISSATTASAAVIDSGSRAKEAENPSVTMAQDDESDGFFLDILSDQTGVNIHRFQAVILNIVFGVWFISKVTSKLNAGTADINLIMPDISQNDLILLGLSSGIYAGLKLTENKTTPPATAEKPANTVTVSEEQPVG